MTTSTKYFDSTMTNAPTISAISYLSNILDACLVNGFDSVTLTSLVVADNVATATVSHNFAMVGNTGMVITIAGATPSGLNGQWRIASVPDSGHFTFSTSGISNQTATGTITAKRSPAGWDKPFTNGDNYCYRSLDTNSTRIYLRVGDSTSSQYPSLIMYETMSDANTGTGASTTFYTSKSNALNSTSRPWRCYADSKRVYLFIDSNSNGTYQSGFFFGDIISYMTNDCYNSMIIAHNIASSAAWYIYALDNASGSEISRSYTQIGSSIASRRYSNGRYTVGIGNTGSPYPNPVDNGFHAWPIEVWEGNTTARGYLPGCWNPIHPYAQINDNTMINGISQLNGHDIKVQSCCSASYRCAMDIRGPWT